MSDPSQAITLLLQRIDDGSHVAPEQLFSLIYDDLRRRAGQLMRAERRDHTLQPTALVNEAFMKVARPGVSFESRAHFFNAAALAMRRILVDHAKARAAGKRGGDWQEISLSDVGETRSPLDVVALSDALDKLAELSPRRAQVVQLRYFAGLGDAEIAKILDVTEKTVQRDWAAARLWLFSEMSK